MTGEDMPQVFGADQLDLMSMASLWVEAVDEGVIERATHPQVAAEARARGLVPLRLSPDPIWHHPETGKIITLVPAHSGESISYNRSIKNGLANLRREYPTPEEVARASRTPEQVAKDQAAAANETRNKKQQAIDSAKRQRDRDAAAAAKAKAETDRILFEKEHAPFRSMDEVQKAFDARSEKAKAARPDDTVEQFAGRLKALPIGPRQQVHRSVFPERYS